MTEYAHFARFYDAVNNEPEARSRKLLRYIEQHLPGATSVLELGCGTGAVLSGLGSGYALTGIDRSSEMLSFARRRCPQAQLHQADITSFSLEHQFDVVLCVYDTLNHVTEFEGWRAVVGRVSEHLREGGLFIFDLNTIGRLRRLGDALPWVHDFDGHTLVMDVEFDEDDARSYWDIRVFEHLDHDRFALHREEIVELGVPLERVRQLLAANFELLDEADPDGEAPTDESARAYFVYRRRAPRLAEGVAG